MEIVLSQGAIQTPKLLMQSGIGDQDELEQFGIPVRQHLPCVVRNLHDHVAFGLIWQAIDAPLPQIARSAAVAFWKTDATLDAPDFYTYGIGFRFSHLRTRPGIHHLRPAWTFFVGMRPTSRGSIHLTSANASDPLQVQANYLADSKDLRDLKFAVQRAP